MSLVKTTGAALLGLLLFILAAIAGLAGLLASPALTLPPSPYALGDIPARMLALYQRAAPTCPGLSWTVLAAIGKVETNHARHPTMVSSAKAVGPMQFLPATFAQYAYPVPPGGKKPPTPWDPVDAVYAAARLLCANGARSSKDLRQAVFAYNHDTAYVNRVLRIAAQYAAGTTAAGAYPAPNRTAAAAVAYARAQIGQPYVWGGDGPTEGGFDCSGLTKAAYAAAGIRLPRVAQDQYSAGPRVPAGAPLLPGDLVFFGTSSWHITHVGIYSGGGNMINAPRPHTVVREERAPVTGSSYRGATRPSSSR